MALHRVGRHGIPNQPGRFFRNIKTRLVQNDRLKDSLNCDLLTVNLTNNEVECGFASGNVQGETAPDESGYIKTITCAQLDAYRNVRTGLMKTIIARTNVVIVRKGHESRPRLERVEQPASSRRNFRP